MSLTENSDQAFLPGGCNRTQNLRFGPYTIILITDKRSCHLKFQSSIAVHYLIFCSFTSWSFLFSHVRTFTLVKPEVSSKDNNRTKKTKQNKTKMYP